MNWEKNSLLIKSILFGRKENISKRVYIWNLVANVVYSLQSALLLMIVTRKGSLAEAGLFSIIYTTTHMFASIGNYNMRNFQVSDARNEYSFGEYFTSRVISCIAMCAVGALYAIINYRNDLYAVAIVLFFVGYRTIEGFEDVIHGFVQKEGRLDVASIAKSVRIIIASSVFMVIYICSTNLLYASFSLFFSSALLFAMFTIAINSEYDALLYRLCRGKVFSLLWICLPICISAFLQNYIVNAPKYAIDAVLSSEVQAVFNILFMPIFAINVLSMFIFNPLVADMGKWWVSGEYTKLGKSIIRQVGLVLGITVFAALLSYLLGCEVLGLLYGVDLKEYKLSLMVLMLFGGEAAIATFFSVIVTIMRKQGFIIIAYAIATGVSICIANTMVYSMGIMGAGLLYGLLMGIVLFILLLVVVLEMRKIS